MSGKKIESFSKKLEKAKPNSTIEFTAKDRADSWWNYEKMIDEKRKDHLNFLFLFLGLVFGITGSYISTQVYDFSKIVLLEVQGKESFFMFNLIVWLIFGVIITIFILKIINNNKQIRELKIEQERWTKAKNIQIGEVYSPEYLEEFNKKIHNQFKNEILNQIKEKRFGILKFSRETNLSIGQIKRYLKELINENIIEENGIFIWKKYKIKQTPKEEGTQ